MLDHNAELAAFAAKYAGKFPAMESPQAILAAIRANADIAGHATALLHVYMAERDAARVPELEAAAPRAIGSAGVIGSGTMGSGIAIALLIAGIPVTLVERDAAALERGTESIRKTLASNAGKGRMSQSQADAALAALQPVQDLAALAEADLIIEAAYETIEVKCEIFSALDGVARQGAILATNTSYLDIDTIAATTGRSEDVVGLHFFSPAHIMKLLEVVRGRHTSPDVLATAFTLAKRLGKIAVLSGNGWGFIGNRMLAVRRKQAEAMVVEGASPAQIDGVMEQFGMAMGPFRVSDLAGLDLGWTPETSTGMSLRERLCEAGRRGQKARAGFYDYDEAMKAQSSPEADRIIAEFARDTGITRREIGNCEVLDRMLWPMVDEATRILAEGIALRESDIDVVWLNGYGWPARTGGPMFHARQTGLKEVISRLERLGIEASNALKMLA